MANLNEFDNGGQSLMDDFVFDWASKKANQIAKGDYSLKIVKHNGSISAEHGIGISKVHYMKKAKTDAQLRIMKTLKDALDPKGIMNPYKIIPEQS